jgi:ribonuclease E
VTHLASIAAAAETAVPASTPRQAETSYETERVREFQPRETATLEAAAPAAPTHSGAGFAPATPVQIEWPSDLQQVESDPGKVQAVQSEPEREPQAPRPKRVRQPAPRVAEEPLVQIETGADEAKPGEKTPA